MEHIVQGNCIAIDKEVVVSNIAIRFVGKIFMLAQSLNPSFKIHRDDDIWIQNADLFIEEVFCWMVGILDEGVYQGPVCLP